MQDSLSNAFQALADPTRRAILMSLSSGEKSVTELAKPFAMSQPAISKHIKVLERAGLVERSRHAQWRPCQLRPEPLRDITEWLEQYRKHWEARFDALDDYLEELQSKENRNDEAQKQTRRYPSK